MEKIKRKDGFRFREKVYVHGKAITSPYFKRKTDARTWKRTQITERDKLKALGGSYTVDISLDEYFEKFIDRRADKTNRTLRDYRSIYVNHISPLLGKTKLRGLKLTQAEDLKTKLRKEKLLSIRRTNNILNLLKTVLNDAVKFDFVVTSPFKALDFIRELPRELVYWLPHEANKFLQTNKDSHYYALYLVTLNMGLRKGEVLGMQLSQLDFFNRQITINHTVDRYELRNTTKNGKARIIKMNDAVYEGLKGYLKHKRQESNQFVFTKPDGSQIDYTHFTNRVFAKDVARAMVRRIKFHELRKTFASNFMMGGGDIYVLSKILGHSSIEVTQRNYAHLHPSFLREESQIISFSAESSTHLALRLTERTQSNWNQKILV